MLARELCTSQKGTTPQASQTGPLTGRHIINMAHMQPLGTLLRYVPYPALLANIQSAHGSNLQQVVVHNVSQWWLSETAQCLAYQANKALIGSASTVHKALSTCAAKHML